MKRAWKRWQRLWAREGAFFVIVILLGIVVFVLAVTLSRFTRVDPAAWLEALSTFAAFIAASVAVNYAYRTWRVEDRREADRLDREAQSQASLVAVWSTGTFVAERQRGRYSPYSGGWFNLRNASQLPIYNVTLTFGGSAAYEDEGGYVAFVDLYLGQKSVGVVVPNDRPVRVDPGQDFYDALQAGCNRPFISMPDVVVALHFDDAEGRSWTRHPDGRLTDYQADYDSGHVTGTDPEELQRQLAELESRSQQGDA